MDIPLICEMLQKLSNIHIVIDIKMVPYRKIYCIPLEKGTQKSCRHDIIKQEST